VRGLSARASAACRGESCLSVRVSAVRGERCALRVRADLDPDNISVLVRPRRPPVRFGQSRTRVR